MGAFHSLPLFTDAYIADTAHLSNEEHGAYLRLLIFAWRSPGCRLVADDARLARMLGVSAGKWAKLKPAVMAFWSLDGAFWVQKRLAKEHAFVEKKVEAKRANGKQGGRPKSLENNGPAEANGLRNESETKAPTPTPIIPPKAPKGAEPDGFVEWWAEYPKRDGGNPRGPAAAKYAAALKAGATPETLLRAARAYRAEVERLGRIGTQYVKQARFWLSEGQWRDYLAKPTADRLPERTVQEWLASLPDDRWRNYVRRWRETVGQWDLQHRTPPPDDARTSVPPRILAEFGIMHHARAA